MCHQYSQCYIDFFFTGAAEMLAMEMKASGMYVSRGLSFRQAEVSKFLTFLLLTICAKAAT